MIHLLDKSTMFRGKSLPGFLQRYQMLYEAIVAEDGIDKVLRVYDYTFKLLSGMQWGQYMRLSRVCPDLAKRQLFFWCIEMIYQSDLISQMKFAVRDGEDVIEIVPPSQDSQQRLSICFGDKRYLYIDWYRRLLADPKCNDEVRPEWLMLDSVADQAQETQEDYDGIYDA